MDVYQKGLDILLQGFAAAAQDLADGQIRLVLTGPDQNNGVSVIRSLAKELNISHLVTIEPETWNGSPAQILQTWDVAVLTSRFEGFGRVVIEALASAIPVLCTDRVGSAQYVKQFGAGIVVACTAEGVEKGMLELVDQRASFTSLGNRGRSQVLSTLSWERIASEAAEAYCELLPHPREGSANG